MSKKKLIKLVALCLATIFLVINIVGLIYGNFYVDAQQIHIFNDKIPESFHNYLIAHISDYHNRPSSLVDKQIIESLTAEEPDIIVITGDLIDSKSLTLTLP